MSIQLGRFTTQAHPTGVCMARKSKGRVCQLLCSYGRLIEMYLNGDYVCVLVHNAESRSSALRSVPSPNQLGRPNAQRRLILEGGGKGPSVSEALRIHDSNHIVQAVRSTGFKYGGSHHRTMSRKHHILRKINITSQRGKRAKNFDHGADPE